MKFLISIFLMLAGLQTLKAENPVPSVGESFEEQAEEKNTPPTPPEPPQEERENTQPSQNTDESENGPEKDEYIPPPPNMPNEENSENMYRRRRTRLTQDEKNFLERRKKSLPNHSRTSVNPNNKLLSKKDILKKSSTTENMKIEVVDEPIGNVFRLISKSYKMNIVPEADLGDLRITIHLEDIPVKDGLKVICQANGLEMNEVGDVIYIKKASEKAMAEMNLYSKRIDISVENKPVKEFVKEFTDKTGISIVPDQDLDGKVTGYVKNELPMAGFKAIMAANNYRLRQKGGIYLVENDGDSQGPPNRLRRRMRGGEGSGVLDLDVVDGMVSASLQDANLKDVVRELTQLADINMVAYGEINGMVDAEFKNISFLEALKIILQGTRYTYIIKDGIALIGERNPKTTSGSVLATMELYPLKYVRVSEAVKLIPKSIGEGTYKDVVEQNALLLTGTFEEIAKLKEFLETIDLPIPQILLEIVVVEYNRNKSSDFGLGVGSDGPNNPRIGGEFEFSHPTQYDLSVGPFTGALGFLPQNWELSLRSKLQKTNGKILSMPKITTLNGNKAHLRVRRTTYYPVSSFNKEGSQSTDYRSIDDGITIDLTPYVTQHGDVNLEIKPSIKTSSPSGEENRPDDVTDRAINTNVRLMNGETIALGGLIESKETIIRNFVPILGQIPILGYFFSARTKTNQTSELVIYVTPHILEAQEFSVDLEREIEGLDERSGIVKDNDFLGTSKKKKNEEKEISTDPKK